MGVGINDVVLQNSLGLGMIGDQTVLLGVMGSLEGNQIIQLGVMGGLGGNEPVLLDVVDQRMSDVIVKSALNTVNLPLNNFLTFKGSIQLFTVAVNSSLNMSNVMLSVVMLVKKTILVSQNLVIVRVHMVQHTVIGVDLVLNVRSLVSGSSVSIVMHNISSGIGTLHVDLSADHLTVLGQNIVLVLVHLSVQLKVVHNLMQSGALLVQMVVDTGKRGVVNDHLLFFDDVAVGNSVLLIIHMSAPSGALGLVQRTVALEPNVQIVVLAVGSAVVHVQVSVRSTDSLGLSISWALALAVFLSALSVALVGLARLAVKSLGDVASQASHLASVTDNISVFVADSGKGSVAQSSALLVASLAFLRIKQFSFLILIKWFLKVIPTIVTRIQSIDIVKSFLKMAFRKKKETNSPISQTQPFNTHQTSKTTTNQPDLPSNPQMSKQQPSNRCLQPEPPACTVSTIAKTISRQYCRKQTALHSEIKISIDESVPERRLEVHWWRTPSEQGRQR